MGGALDLHGEVLQQIFAHFSGVDATDKKAKMAAGMMNVMECHELCEVTGLYTIGENEFTIREMLVCFVKVNLDDDLFYQESYTYYGYTLTMATLTMATLTMASLTMAILTTTYASRRRKATTRASSSSRSSRSGWRAASQNRSGSS